MKDFSGKTAVITGAASGIGKGIAKRAVQLGCKVVLADIEGDAFFPAWDETHWRETQREHHAIDERHQYAFDYVTLKRV